VRAFDRACEARAEVLAMIAAWRVSVGAGPDAAPPEELRACLAVADEECTAAGDAWARAVAGLEAAEAMASGDFEPDAEMLEERRAARAEHGELLCSLAPAGGHYGDA
jgi:hypothetical protein